ncbi:MAG: energy transducer TonB [Ignavibacteria bacterium]
MKPFLKNRSLSAILTFTAVVLFASSLSYASPDNNKSTSELNPAFSQIADLIPEPVGGYSSLTKKITYPVIAKNAKLEGEVLAKVTVDKNGSVTNVSIVKSLSGGCDEAVKEALSTTKFKVSVYDGVAVNSQVYITIKFRMSDI